MAVTRLRVDSDHKPLEYIFQKPLHSEPKRLQRMLLRPAEVLPECGLQEREEMFLADTLSRAYLPEVNSCEFTQELEKVDTENHCQSPKRDGNKSSMLLLMIQSYSSCRATIRRGWPENKSEIPECLYPFFDMRDVLTVQNELVFKGHLLVVPACMRKELMAVAHSSHMALKGVFVVVVTPLLAPHVHRAERVYLQV